MLCTHTPVLTALVHRRCSRTNGVSAQTVFPHKRCFRRELIQMALEPFTQMELVAVAVEEMCCAIRVIENDGAESSFHTAKSSHCS